ncbi:MAG: hypothetical protein HC853_07115, partial [Anaerolineae bacterium]|nr:hypothetical protein [Anaerolineae bacterium]
GLVLARKARGAAMLAIAQAAIASAIKPISGFCVRLSLLLSTLFPIS